MASATLTLTSRGQITIPQKIRKALNLGPMIKLPSWLRHAYSFQPEKY